ncbi:23S rRNA (adenine(1618)-N(6))-methyltransferase RlmF [Maribacter algarum]|uniref:Ribosomal RNA large subunit methyltransferase F n=1 Tax=Maribacter algarum (ex Zhang et al. 2020) TaxID=2578118 RepID=A0A5S3PTS1_9FLAO|nr:23S rRNA (adenine(1618)-N(6))-methyltransferase RlmF [Maribacter algarum]TMM57323.1 23S rRNA (adenine(1618)-N(6))-methyltransferase RlmF [Maribacter algarum]
MHPSNIHNTPYDFEALSGKHPELSSYVFRNSNDAQTIDFANPSAVLALNKAILKHSYGLVDWNIPEGYLCPPIPGRADYIHHISSILKEEGIDGTSKGLDIGVGANCIYPILGAQIYNWQMVGSDIDEKAVLAARSNVESNPQISKSIEIRHQKDNANIFKGVIEPDEYFHFTLCNPPFYKSKEHAEKETIKKQKNLGYSEETKRNFGGQANELWCNGGEALFLKRMIKQSVHFKKQVGVFTCLVSKSEHLPKIKKQLKKLAAEYYTVEIEHGNKKSRIIVWKFN